MEPSFDRILNSVRQYLKDANELTPENEEMLGKLQEGVQIVKRIEEEESELSKFLDVTFKRMLYSCCITLTRCSTAAMSKVLREIIPEESKLPKPMQPIVREIRTYFGLIQKQHEKINSCLDEIKTKASSIFLENVGR